MQLCLRMNDDLVQQMDKRAKELYMTRTAFVTMAVQQKLQGDTVIDLLPDMVRAIADEKKG